MFDRAVMNQEKRNSISVTLKDVEKFMAKHLTCEHIFAVLGGERPFICNWMFCGKRFTRSDELQGIEELIQVNWFILSLVTSFLNA